MKRIASIFALCSVCCSFSVAAQEGGKALFSENTGGMFTRGTMQAGGAAGLRVDAIDPDEGDSTEGVVINLSPIFGYFIIDNLELGLVLSMQIPTGDLYEDMNFNLNVMAGARYFIPLGRLAAHVGFFFGGGGMWNDGPDLEFMSLQIPAGVLLPLNKHVALDFGLKVNVLMLMDGSDYLGALIRVPIGYVGVEGFF